MAAREEGRGVRAPVQGKSMQLTARAPEVSPVILASGLLTARARQFISQHKQANLKHISFQEE